MLKIGNTYVVNNNDKTIAGKLVGIDSYILENFKSKEHKWKSYTFTSNKRSTLKRYWVTDWKSDGWILWTILPKLKITQKHVLVEDRSGIATIAFVGDQGVSTPSAAVVVTQISSNVYNAMERFSGSEVMFFKGIKIGKPILLRTK